MEAQLYYVILTGGLCKCEHEITALILKVFFDVPPLFFLSDSLSVSLNSADSRTEEQLSKHTSYNAVNKLVTF